MADVSSVNAIIKNGEVVNAKNETTNKTAPTGYDKDAFMQILVAQMKYQDPMEPTSNTEYINQYATFTQVEQLSNMANAMSLSRASEMVGKTVVVSQTNPDTGKTTEVEGTVDFVTYSGNKAYLNINGTNYSIDDVSQVLDPNYTSAVEAVKDFQKAIDKLPTSLDMVTEEDHGLTIDTMYQYYTENMDERAKNMMDKNYVTALLQYVNRIDDIRGDTHRTFTEKD
ncbi:flagellar hook capping FlgD N-terminal domain-containing protein [Butyrivibrio sp. VCB2001]|jgi:flagellar basal-body rod modification protein FlgD|uniref:flagellar hook capping FlgD N-terminal domain-containing protein n=1 Tax=Butyrivibrio sp. VCB2001 TaxID=1280667 RepID=UPI000405126A|nr:flagellar hook capping FlgD N-terminal domain-containing protein [Butyrivibrio sp. VCB2001]